MKFKKCFIGAMTLLAFTLNSPQVLANGDSNNSAAVPTEVPEGVPHLDDEDIETYDFEVDDDYTFDEYEDIVPLDSDDYVFDEDEDIVPLDDDYFFDEEEDIVPLNRPKDDSLGYDKHDYDFNDDYYGGIDNPFDDSVKTPRDDDVETVELPRDDTEIIFTPRDDDDRILPPSRIGLNEPEEKVKEPHLKKIKARFIKLAVDDTYTYYLDKQSIAWKRMPYSASEYMAEVWIRMIEHKPDYSDVPDYLNDNLEDDFSAQIEFAREKGYQYAPIDIEVLKHKHYYLEHYYLRPKTKQIQFISELEVVGHPQNTITERAYEYKNWEYLIPDSVESIIYSTTIKEIGKSKSSEKGHMTFTDMLEEYGRISIR